MALFCHTITHFKHLLTTQTAPCRNYTPLWTHKIYIKYLQALICSSLVIVHVIALPGVACCTLPPLIPRTCPLQQRPCALGMSTSVAVVYTLPNCCEHLNDEQHRWTMLVLLSI